METGRFANLQTLKMDRQNGDRRCPAALFLPVDLAVPQCMRQIVWGADRMMVAESCLNAWGRWVSSAHLLMWGRDFSQMVTTGARLVVFGHNWHK